MICITPDFRNDVETLLSPYITGSYSEDAKNPVMLLNFLHQHWVISKPEYETQPDENLFLTSCSIGSIRTEAKGKSKKEAKANAAKKILDLVLGNDTWDIDQTEHNSVSSNTKSSDGRELDVLVESMSISDTDEVLFKEDVSNVGTRFKRKNTRPKKANREINFYEDDLSGIFSFEDSRKSHFDVNYLDCNNYKMPNYISKRGMPEKKTDTYSLIGNTEQRVQPQCSFDVACLSDSPGSSATTIPASKFFDTSTSQQSYGTVQDYIMWNNSNINGGFFDPFSRVRPPTLLAAHASFSKQEKKEVTDISEQLMESSGESVASGSSKKGSKIMLVKTPFQILQEKSLKKFKLIPRCNIETTENGFKCTLIIDAYTGTGEGRSKREAKVNAALVLLQQLEDILRESHSPAEQNF